MSEGWEWQNWERLLSPLLNGEAQHSYFSLPPQFSENYKELKLQILSLVGLSPITATQILFDWE